MQLEFNLCKKQLNYCVCGITQQNPNKISSLVMDPGKIMSNNNYYFIETQQQIRKKIKLCH